MPYAIGLDVGSTYCKGIVLDENHEIVGRYMRPTGARLGEAAAATAAATAKAAGIEGVTAQVLRITFGSIAVQAGIDIYQVSEWLGHSDVATTRKHYAALLSHNPDIGKI